MWCGWNYRYVLFDLEEQRVMGELETEADARRICDLLNFFGGSA